MPALSAGNHAVIHLLQQWYDLSDQAMKDALIEVPTLRRFIGIDMISDRISDETRFCRSGICWRSTSWAIRSLSKLNPT